MNSPRFHWAESSKKSWIGIRKWFVRVWIVVLIFNLVGSWVLVNMQVALGQQSLSRDTSFFNRPPKVWPIKPIETVYWPDPKNVAEYTGAIPLVRSTLATSWDNEGNKYFMEVVHMDLPSVIYAKGTIRMSNRSGTIIPRYSRPTVTSAIINPLALVWYPLVQTAALMLPFVLYIFSLSWYRYRLEQRNYLELLCLQCGYDILDLPICPECGSPSHKSEALIS